MPCVPHCDARHVRITASRKGVLQRWNSASCSEKCGLNPHGCQHVAKNAAECCSGSSAKGKVGAAQTQNTAHNFFAPGVRVANEIMKTPLKSLLHRFWRPWAVVATSSGVVRGLFQRPREGPAPPMTALSVDRP
jgi:hypothetical protein